MAELNETPSANRIRIAFFGLRNAGKSTLVNAFAGQDVAIVSDVAGTTTDPVSKAMEILPLGPCLITDTAGLDDVGELGAMRVEKTLRVLAATDIAVWVFGGGESDADAENAMHARFLDECRRRGVTVLEYRRGDDVEELRRKVAAVKVTTMQCPVMADLVSRGDVVLLVCPQDGSAPKGRLILPQQQVIRELLDAGCVAQVCQPELLHALFGDGVSSQSSALRPKFAITDSQAFGAVDAALSPEIPLTSFSILFARAKGDISAFCEGLAALKSLEDGDVVLVAEGCTHHRQCGDIGTVKLPKAVEKLSGKRLKFKFCSGGDFPLPSSQSPACNPKLVIHCGGCMLARREMARRLELAREAGVPITNYGLVLAAANGIVADPVTCMVRRKVRQ